MIAPRLHVELTAHGYGHLAQTAPVLNALRRRLPALRLSVRSALPSGVLHDHLEGEFLHVEQAGDVGMLMGSAVDVLAAESAAAYRRVHGRAAAEVASLEALYSELRPDLVLVNAPWLPLEAAQRAGVPALGLSSLDWATVLERYCGAEAGMDTVLGHMRACYALAAPFLRPQPAYLDVPWLAGRAVGPVARVGTDLRGRLATAKRVDRLVLVALGGIPTELPLHRWPRREGVTYLAPMLGATTRDDWCTPASVGLGFLDALASADVVVTKPGYGTFVEAACNGVRVLYSPRPDWPEEPLLSAWLEEHCAARALPRDALWAGEFGEALDELLATPRPRRVRPSGVDEAASLLAARWAY